MAVSAVTFTTSDGVVLSGRLYGTGTTGVVLAHMYPADQSSWASFAERLASKGYAALTFDFRGYGRSGGTKEIGLIDRDMMAALGFLQGHGAERVFLIGASMGGTASLLVARDKPVAGVVTLSTPVAFMGLDASEAVKEVAAPKLFIAGVWDVPAREGLTALFEAAPKPKERFMVESNAHGTDLLGVDRGVVEQRILRFLAVNQEAP